MVPITTTRTTVMRSAQRTISTALSRTIVMAGEGRPFTTSLRTGSKDVDGRDKPGHDEAVRDADAPSCRYGQIFFGFFPIPNDFGSAAVNSSTEALNPAHWPLASHAIGPPIPSNLVANTASRNAFLP